MNSRLEAIVKGARSDNGGWPLTQPQSRALFGEGGLLEQRGLVGTHRIQQAIASGVPAHLLDFLGFGEISMDKLLQGMIGTYAISMRFTKYEGGFDVVAEEMPHLAVVSADELKAECIADDETTETEFRLYPVKRLYWQQEYFGAEALGVSMQDRDRLKSATFGQVWSYVHRRMQKGDLLPRHIVIPRFFSTSGHRPNTAFLLLIRPYEGTQIFPIAMSTDPATPDHSRRELLQEICRQCRISVQHVFQPGPQLDTGGVAFWAGYTLSK